MNFSPMLPNPHFNPFNDWANVKQSLLDGFSPDKTNRVGALLEILKPDLINHDPHKYEDEYDITEFRKILIPMPHRIANPKTLLQWYSHFEKPQRGKPIFSRTTTQK